MASLTQVFRRPARVADERRALHKFGAMPSSTPVLSFQESMLAGRFIAQNRRHPLPVRAQGPRGIVGYGFH